MRISIGVVVCLLAVTGNAQVPNPVVSSAKEIFVRQSAFIQAAMDEMPADKFGYHPTPDQWSFGKIVAHVAQANDHVCAMLTAQAGTEWVGGDGDFSKDGAGGGTEGFVRLLRDGSGHPSGLAVGRYDHLLRWRQKTSGTRAGGIDR